MSDFKVFFERLQESLTKDEFVKLTLSKPMRKSEGLLNVYVRLFKVDGKDIFELKYRFAEENEFKQFSFESLTVELEKLLLETFRTACLFTLSEDLIVLVSKKKLVSYRDNAPSFKNKLPEIPMQS
ncbi:hypothetical protein BTO15_13410 [Polaribacter sejongensis]|uniref:Uncharacterized protein n=1 Tax=Polaribacter sejongensis TaxID=985043 RepID=A0ABN5F6C9_9FLAO|nr:hypothetical protein [Polaribacter sejongensis]AUC23027.1 hypothetical protein BTO15_13410 [Polaribacter sejongensis]